MKPIRIFDLTHPLSDETPVHPLDAPVRVERPLSHEKHGMVVSSVRLSSHAGTHMDAPYHMLADGRTLDQYPVSRFIGEAVVLDLRGREAAISGPDLAEAVRAAGGLRAGDFVFVCTGWDTHYGLSDMFAHPYLSKDAARFVADLGATLVGIDTPSVDCSQKVREADGLEAFDLSAHLLLMSADILIVEGLRGLAPLVGRRVRCAVLPLHVLHAEGAPVRAVAWLE